MSVSLGLPRDLQLQIFSNLTYSEILNVCQTNLYYQTLCSNPTFWRRLLIMKYHLHPSLLDRYSDYQNLYHLLDRLVPDHGTPEEILSELEKYLDLNLTVPQLYYALTQDLPPEEILKIQKYGDLDLVLKTVFEQKIISRRELDTIISSPHMIIGLPAIYASPTERVWIVGDRTTVAHEDLNDPHWAYVLGQEVGLEIVRTLGYEINYIDLPHEARLSNRHLIILPAKIPMKYQIKNSPPGYHLRLWSDGQTFKIYVSGWIPHNQDYFLQGIAQILSRYGITILK